MMVAETKVLTAAACKKEYYFTILAKDSICASGAGKKSFSKVISRGTRRKGFEDEVYLRHGLHYLKKIHIKQIFFLNLKQIKFYRFF